MSEYTITPRGGRNLLPRDDENAELFRVTDKDNEWQGDFPTRDLAELLVAALEH